MLSSAEARSAKRAPEPDRLLPVPVHSRHCRRRFDRLDRPAAAGRQQSAWPWRLTRMAAALIEPMREIYGVSDKVLAMALSAPLLGAHEKMILWAEVGGAMIAIDTLVHNFLHRTGILARFKAEHMYGAACYRPSGCADILQAVAERIDARQFNPTFPQTFPRFVQHAIWQYCARNGLDVCNGNRISDVQRCDNLDCRVRLMCDRVALRKAVER